MLYYILHHALVGHYDYMYRYWLKEVLKLTEATTQGCSWKKCSENMQEIYRRTPMPKCDFSKEIALRYGCSTVNLLHIFRTPFLRTPLDASWFCLSLQIFKGCLSQVLLGPFLNTVTHVKSRGYFSTPYLFGLPWFVC